MLLGASDPDRGWEGSEEDSLGRILKEGLAGNDNRRDDLAGETRTGKDRSLRGQGTFLRVQRVTAGALGGWGENGRELESGKGAVWKGRKRCKPWRASLCAAGCQESHPDFLREAYITSEFSKGCTTFILKMWREQGSQWRG